MLGGNSRRKVVKQFLFMWASSLPEGRLFSVTNTLSFCGLWERDAVGSH